jgi:chitodextrinase
MIKGVISVKTAISNQKFSKLQLLLFALAFALVGYLIWRVSFAEPLPAANQNQTVPFAPLELKSVGPAVNSVELQWQPALNNVSVSGYYIIRNGVTINQVSSTIYQDTDTEAGSSYSYAVEAYTEAGKVSLPSNIVKVTVPLLPAKSDKIAPSAPDNLMLSVARSSQINLSWDRSNDNKGVSSYDIYRNGEKIANVHSTSFGDTTVLPRTTYTYWVIARDESGNSSPTSSKAHVTTASGEGSQP